MNIQYGFHHLNSMLINWKIINTSLNANPLISLIEIYLDMPLKQNYYGHILSGSLNLHKDIIAIKKLFSKIFNRLLPTPKITKFQANFLPKFNDPVPLNTVSQQFQTNTIPSNCVSC